MASASRRFACGLAHCQAMVKLRLGDKGDEGWWGCPEKHREKQEVGTQSRPLGWTVLYKWSLANLLLCYHSQGSWVETHFTVSKTKGKKCFHNQRKVISGISAVWNCPRSVLNVERGLMTRFLTELIVLNFLWSWSSLILSSAASMYIFKLLVTYFTLCYRY